MMSFIKGIILRPIKSCLFFFRKITCRGYVYYFYMKSGNVVKVTAESVDIDITNNIISWTHRVSHNNTLLHILPSEVEAVVVRNW